MRLLEWLLTIPLMFPHAHMMRSAKHVWVWEGSSHDSGMSACLYTVLVVIAPARS